MKHFHRAISSIICFVLLGMAAFEVLTIEQCTLLMVFWIGIYNTFKDD